MLSDSDWEAYSVSSDSEDQDDIESIYGGHAQSILSSLTESIGKIDDFLAFERGFAHGDIVCSTTDPSRQFGRVVDVDMTVDLEGISGDVIKGVCSKKLLKLRPFAAGDYVVHGPWLGRVDRVVDLLTILFEDGAKCEITAANPESLIPISPNSLEDALYPYYPGQHVRIRISTALKSAKWLCGKWKANREEGIVRHVEVGSIYVNWIASVIVGCKFGLAPPPSLQHPENLTLLSCFPHANWQLGDWCVLPDAYHSDQVDTKEQVHPNVSAQLFKMYTHFGRGPNKRDPECGNIFVIVKTKTKADVIWQDGSCSCNLDSQALIPVDNLGDHDFWPDQFVTVKGAYENDLSAAQRVGVVKNVDANERTVKVKWEGPKMNQTIESHSDCEGEVVSAYELVEHPGYSYCLGDVVFRLFPFIEKWDAIHVIQNKEQIQGQEDPQNTKMDMQSLKLTGKVLEKKHIEEGQVGNNNAYLSCIGNVIGSKDGGIEVKWANGLISKVCKIVAVSSLKILVHSFDYGQSGAICPCLRI
ncbi:hypothetical protein ACLOJK_008576 [Asimina triloba]